MIVVITSAAEADLERIGNWIAERNPERAVTFVRELRDRCERLADAPHAFPRVLRYADSGIRRRPFREHLIFYRIGADVIEVLHVLHGAQDYEHLLFRET